MHSPLTGRDDNTSMNTPGAGLYSEGRGCQPPHGGPARDGDPALDGGPLPGPPERRLNRRQLLGLAGLGGVVAAAGTAYLVEHPAAAHPAPRAQAAHLLRRAGFAPSQAELTAAMARGLSRTIDDLVHPERVDDSALDAALAGHSFDFTKVADLRRWWLTRMALSRRPLVEKMTFFWHGLLTSSIDKAGKGALMYVQHPFLRSHALGTLGDLMTGISRDGAMLRWLDGTGSNKAHPNENYAREFMELFTMGVGNYTQADVTAAARAFTGWVVDQQGQVSFRPPAHDDGVKTFLGHTGKFGLNDIVSIVLAHPATPRYLAGRLWSFFAYPNPSDADLAPVVEAYSKTHGNIAAMLEAVLRSPGFAGPTAYRALVKSPTELIAGLARQLSIPVDALAGYAGQGMGHATSGPAGDLVFLVAATPEYQLA
ncbi:MAG: hypothetical protein NVSMB32_17400 [Actinomycetota bacterium]